MARCANGHRAEVHGVILDILRRDIADLAGVGKRLLLERVLNEGLAPNGNPKLALGMDLITKEIRAFCGRVESVFAKEMNVGLGARWLVIGVVDKIDPA